MDDLIQTKLGIYYENVRLLYIYSWVRPAWTPHFKQKSGGEELGGEHGGQARLPRGLQGGKQAAGWL